MNEQPHQHRKAGFRTRRPILCRCELCAGRAWTIDEIRALPNFPNKAINPFTLPSVGRATGHAFHYAAEHVAGIWRKRDARDDAPARPAAPAKVKPAPARPRTTGTDELLPVNPMRLTAKDGPAPAADRGAA